MDEEQAYTAVYIVTKRWCDELNGAELLGLNLTITLGNDPRKLPCYDKISGMFQEEYDPPKMHDLTRQALAALVKERMKGL